MRRGIGVGRLQQQQHTTQQMADLGAQLTAERVGLIADQLETLEQQLRKLMAKHKEKIQHDPLVRARFRQLAESLGMDMISSKENVFAKSLGLGDFYYTLASKLVEVCMRERKFCGSYVPLASIQRALQRMYDAQSTFDLSQGDAKTEHEKSSRIIISDGDIKIALEHLRCLGGGYSVVKLANVKYVQTTPDGASGVDEVPVLNHVIELQRAQLDAWKRKQLSTAHASSRQTSPAASVTTSAASAVDSRASRLGAAYVLGAHPLLPDDGSEAGALETAPLHTQCVAVTEATLAEGLGWPAHRVRAVLRRMVQDGSVWMDCNDTAIERSAVSAGQRAPAGGRAPVFSAVETGGKRRYATDEVNQQNTTYWFVSLTSSAEARD